MPLTGAQNAVVDHILSNSKDELLPMTNTERESYVNDIITEIRSKSDDDIISVLSKNKKDVNPAIIERIDMLQKMQKSEPQRTGSILMGTKAIPGELEHFEAEAQHIKGLQEIGVKTGQDLPAGGIEIGFSPDPVKAIKTALDKEFGKDTMVFRRGEDILYLNPLSGSMERVEPGMIQGLGFALPVSADIAGTVIGGVVGGGATKSPAGAVAGEAAGSALFTTQGEALRLMIGKWAGFHDMSYPDIFKKAGITGLKAGAGTGAIGSIMASAKGVSNFFKGGIFTKHDAMLHGLNSKEADAVMAEVNKILARTGSKEKIKGTLGRMTSDVTTISKEAELRRISEFAQKFIERDAKDQKLLLEVFESITKTGQKGAPEAAEALGKQVTKKITKAREIVATNVKELQVKLTSIGKVSKELVGEPTRKVILAKSEAAKKAQSKVWTDLKSKHGFNEATESFGISIPRGKGATQLAAISKRRAETAQIAGVKSAETKGLVQKAKMADLEDYNHNLSILRADIRSAKASRKAGDATVAGMKKIEQSLIEDRRLALITAGKGGLLKDIEKAEKATADYYKTYRRSVLGDLTKKNDRGVFEIKAKEFVDKTLKGSPDEADQLISIIGDSPTLVSLWKEGIGDAYKRAAFKNGKFNREASTKFLKSHEDVLAKFFDAGDLAKLEKAGSLAEKITKQSDQLKTFISQANKKWGRGKMKSLDPDNLVNFITNNTGSFIKGKGVSEQGVQVAVNKIKYVKGFLQKNHPAAWQELKDNFSEQIRKASTDIKTKEISATHLNKVVSDQKDEIIELMGRDYYKDLIVVNRAVQLAGKKLVKLSDQEMKQGVLAVARAVVAPPLTRRGRALTAANIFETRWARRKIGEALLDPSTIKKVAEAAEHKMLTRQSAELYISLGFIGEE